MFRMHTAQQRNFGRRFDVGDVGFGKVAWEIIVPCAKLRPKMLPPKTVKRKQRKSWNRERLLNETKAFNKKYYK